MKDFLKTTLIVGLLLCVGLYIYHEKIAPPPMVEPVAEEPPLEKIPILRLSRFIDSHVDKILSPLSHRPTPVPTHELRMLKEQFKDQLQNRVGSRDATLCAIRLCNTLLEAIAIREKHVLRLTSAQTANRAAMTSNAYDEFKENQKRRAFFSSATNRSWLEATQTIKARIDHDYALLREQERNLLRPVDFNG